MSRSCPRVGSPSPGRSTLITSAPNQARSWVQVGPDCTWVKSRIRTPSSALPAWPHGFVLGAGRPLVTAAAFFGAALALAADFFATTFAGLRAALFAGRAAAFFDLDLFAMVAPYFLRSALCGLRLPMRPL